MQRPDEQKRQLILASARDLFARHAFHEVRLEDIASAAKVGKGTLYVYFDSKEALFLAMIVEAFDRLLDELRAIAAEKDVAAETTIDRIVRRLSAWTLRNPKMFELMRSNVDPAGSQALRRRRKALGELIHSVLREGKDRGEIDDPNPALTAQFIPAMARSGVVWSTRTITADELADHIMLMLRPRFRKGRR